MSPSIRVLFLVLVAGTVQAMESKSVTTDSAAKVIAEYRESGDVSVISRFILELKPLSADATQGGSSGELFSFGSEILNALYDDADLAFSWERKPKGNVRVPGGKYPSGIDPKSIEDPTVRAEYEKVLAEERGYARRYGHQSAIFREIDRMGELLWQAKPSRDTAEISRLLLRHGVKSSYVGDIVKRMEKKGHAKS